MIVALTGMDDAAASDLAQKLALLRTAAGGKVLLVSPAQAAEPQPPHGYDDVVIDTGDNGGSAQALAMAGVIVVLIRPCDLEAHRHRALLERIKRASEINPQARVLVSVAREDHDLSPHEVGCILVFVAQISSARLADMLVLDERGSYHTRHSELEPAGARHGDALCAPEVRNLYRQVFQAARMN